MAGNRVNIKRFHYAPLTKDDATGVTYGPPKAIPGIEQASINPKVATGTLYGDGVIRDERSKLTGATIGIDINKLPTEDRAIILGNTVGTDGVITETPDDEPIELAIGWEVELTGGDSEFVWFLKCKAQPLNENVEQTTENIKFSNNTITFTAMPREFDNDIRKFADTTMTSFTGKDTWFDTVPGGTTTP